MIPVNDKNSNPILIQKILILMMIVWLYKNIGKGWPLKQNAQRFHPNPVSQELIIMMITACINKVLIIIISSSSSYFEAFMTLITTSL